MNKGCKICGIEKAIEQFSIRAAAKDGRFNNCKPCETARVKTWTLANPAKVKAWADKNRAANVGATLPIETPRTCHRCKVEKTIADFHANPRSKDNVRKICKECTTTHMAVRYQENPDKQRAKTTKWRAENPEKNKAYAAAYLNDNRAERNEHRRQFRLKNIERERDKDREYTKNNYAKVLAKNAKRRASRVEATPSWLTFIHQALISEFYETAVARTMQTGVDHCVDHVVPLRGKGVRGLHVPWNLQVLTREENSRKYNKLEGIL